MSVVAAFSIPASAFAIGRALREAPHLAVEVEEVVPVGTATMPYVWVVGTDRADFDAALEDDDQLASFRVVDQLEDRALYRVEWDESEATLLRLVESHDAVVQEAAGDDEAWTFQLRFPDSHTLSEFHSGCQAADVDLTVERLSNPIEPTAEALSRLTEPQRSLIEKAYDRGYFEVPRQITLAELSEEIGISDQAVNERMRRGLSALVESTLRAGRSRQNE